MPSPRKPTAIHPDLESVLLDADQIRRRVKALGRALKRVYRDEEFTVVAIMNGAILFTADLLREVDNPVRLDCIRISSYGAATESRGIPKLIHGLTLDVADRHVLIVDDILDTGKTLSLLASMIGGLKPKSVRVCVLLDKEGRRQVPFEADLVGFKIPDKFVVGYGLDFAERYRNLTCIGVLRPDRQSSAAGKPG
ncbi:MAG: hypoxanthine phosphoribosyltransferase [Verrucomicrobia bacterium]|nr:hypoxanthine phosphoribosyltransferase [Verrucomicrobiota bacterium]